MTKEELVAKYPFLKADPEYNYVDAPDELYSDPGVYLPAGWIDLFLACCEELRNILVQTNRLNDFKLNQVKEKFGSMRIYPNFADSAINEVISRYEIISQFTCCECGKTATIESTGWVCPYCTECGKKIKVKTNPITYLSTTSFFKDGETGADRVSKHYYTATNLPKRPSDCTDQNYYVMCPDGVITMPANWRALTGIGSPQGKPVFELSKEIESIIDSKVCHGS